MKTQHSMGVSEELFLETTHAILTDSKNDISEGVMGISAFL